MALSNFRPQLLENLGQMKLQVLQILFVFFLRNRTGFLLLFKLGNLIQQLLFTTDQFIATLPARQRLFMQLDRVADAPEQECADGEDDKPGVRAHGIGHIGSSRAFVLGEEQ